MNPSPGANDFRSDKLLAFDGGKLGAKGVVQRHDEDKVLWIWLKKCDSEEWLISVDSGQPTLDGGSRVFHIIQKVSTAYIGIHGEKSADFLGTSAAQHHRTEHAAGLL